MQNFSNNSNVSASNTSLTVYGESNPLSFFRFLLILAAIAVGGLCLSMICCGGKKSDPCNCCDDSDDEDNWSLMLVAPASGRELDTVDSYQREQHDSSSDEEAPSGVKPDQGGLQATNSPQRNVQ